MNGYLIAAGAIAAVTTLIHVIGGHFNPVLPMLRADFDVVAKRTMHVVWHFASLNLALSAAALLAAGVAPERWAAGGLLAQLMAVQFLGYTLIFAVITLATRVRLAAMPQPILLAPVAILSWLGR